MEWFAGRKPTNLPGSVWRDWSGPAGDSGDWASIQRDRQKRQACLIERLLSPDPGLRDDLATYLGRALGLAERVREPVVQALLWERPRALMTSVLPTLLRRLNSNWSCIAIHPGEPARDVIVTDHPL